MLKPISSFYFHLNRKSNLEVRIFNTLNNQRGIDDNYSALNRASKSNQLQNGIIVLSLTLKMIIETSVS